MRGGESQTHSWQRIPNTFKGAPPLSVPADHLVAQWQADLSKHYSTEVRTPLSLALLVSGCGKVPIVASFGGFLFISPRRYSPRAVGCLTCRVPHFLTLCTCWLPNILDL